MIRCKVCEKTIRGNAAVEEYHETKQETEYVCKKCEKLFAKIGLGSKS